VGILRSLGAEGVHLAQSASGASFLMLLSQFANILLMRASILSGGLLILVLRSSSSALPPLSVL